MSVAIIGAVLALSVHLFYSFSSRSAMLGVDWVALSLTVVTVSVMLVRLEREPILKQLWSATPDRFAWTGGFVYRVAMYGALPLVTLFAWQFPEVAGELVGWLDPVRKAVP
jgi:hypothetical protein